MDAHVLVQHRQRLAPLKGVIEGIGHSTQERHSREHARGDPFPDWDFVLEHVGRKEQHAQEAQRRHLDDAPFKEDQIEAAPGSVLSDYHGRRRNYRIGQHVPAIGDEDRSESQSKECQGKYGGLAQKG